MNNIETAGTTPATDEQIFARLKELSARASEYLGAKARAGAYWSHAYGRGQHHVELCDGSAFGIGETFEAALSVADTQYRVYRRRAAIEARIRAEMGISA